LERLFELLPLALRNPIQSPDVLVEVFCLLGLLLQEVLHLPLEVVSLHSFISLLSKVTSEKLYLIFSLKDPGHQSRAHCGCEPHGGLGVVQFGIGPVPVEYPHHQQTTEGWIMDPFPILEPELLRTTNHIRPQGIIVVEICKLVLLPSTLVETGLFTRDPLLMDSFLGNLHTRD